MMTAEYFGGKDDVTRDVSLDENDHRVFDDVATAISRLADAIAGSGKRRTNEKHRDPRADQEFRLACLAAVNHLGEGERYDTRLPRSGSGPEGLLNELGVVLIEVERLTAVVKDVCDWAGGVDLHAAKVATNTPSPDQNCAATPNEFSEMGRRLAVSLLEAIGFERPASSAAIRD